MMVQLKRFNIYLLVALAAVLAGGCQSAEKKKKQELATLHLHIETNPHGSEHTQVASIMRESPFDVTVEKTPFIIEGSVAEAKVINAMGGFAISIQFNREGTWLLEQYTSGNNGRKIAVLSQFGKDLAQHRWLAAPVITKRISNGLFVFTPDASREEAEEIVLGLNNVVKKLRGNWLLHDQ
jgi:preprotein translocase subunit SecD